MGHTYANVLVHFIFSTKLRRPLIREDFQQRLYEYMYGVARQELGGALRIGGTSNHIHGLLYLRSDISASMAMQKWKSLSSGWVHKQIEGAEDFAWQSGYGAFSVSQSNSEQVVRYIDRQEAHHKTQTFEEEFLEFL